MTADPAGRELRRRRPLERRPRASAHPRVVAAGDENRLTGNPGLPLVINPYLDSFGAARPVAGAIRPGAGTYDVVFDTPACPPGSGPAFTFRFWVNDVTPPTVRLLVAHGKRRVRARGSPSPTPAQASTRSRSRRRSTASRRTSPTQRGRAAISLTGVAPGRHRARLHAPPTTRS